MTIGEKAISLAVTRTSILRSLELYPIPHMLGQRLIMREHYLRSFPAGTKLVFGVYSLGLLKGAIALGIGPTNAHCLVRGAIPDDCLTLTRLWLSPELPKNSESRVIGIIVKALHRYTDLKFLLSYADPAAGHVGTIYQAAGWLYTGLSSATPLYDIGDGRLHHSRSLAHHFGSHSLRFLSRQGINIQVIQQTPKHRYIRFLDESWQTRLNVPVLPYPKKGEEAGEDTVH